MRRLLFCSALVVLGCGGSVREQATTDRSGSGGAHDGGATSSAQSGAANASGGTISSGGTTIIAVGGAGGSAGSSDGECRISLSDLASLSEVVGNGCPATFDGTFAQLPQPGCDEVSPAPCEGLVWFTISALPAWLCAYDATTHELSGIQFFDDVAELCNNSSATETAGRLPSAQCIRTAVPCDSDAGGTAGAGDDQCMRPLSELAHYCKPTFDGSEDEAAKAGCSSYSTSACEGSLWIRTGGLGGHYCTYDATTHDLVGAAAYNDTPGPCSDPGFDAIAGRLPSSSCLSQWTDCSDLSVAGAPN